LSPDLLLVPLDWPLLAEDPPLLVSVNLGRTGNPGRQEEKENKDTRDSWVAVVFLRKTVGKLQRLEVEGGDWHGEDGIRSMNLPGIQCARYAVTDYPHVFLQPSDTALARTTTRTNRTRPSTPDTRPSLPRSRTSSSSSEDSTTVSHTIWCPLPRLSRPLCEHPERLTTTRPP
jgi:hypothetical protein